MTSIDQVIQLILTPIVTPKWAESEGTPVLEEDRTSPPAPDFVKPWCFRDQHGQVYSHRG